ncbi:hypothetical protein BC830DRAFT_1079246 [Chytriomyces sp. MP71]|nr:hypothetical protein BC830DRAFT_1079246 [Chytriomyces sp. MP71]
MSFVAPLAPASKLKAAPPATEEAARDDLPPTAPPLNYEVPEWSAVASMPFRVEILKAGSIVGEHSLSDPVTVVGRLPTCTLSLDHASVSRNHAILQQSATSLFLFDLSSAHGTHLNKQPAPPRSHVELHDGDQIRFGMSTRVFVIVGGPARHRSDEDQPATPRKRTVPIPTVAPREEAPHEISWGFAEDASAEDAAYMSDAEDLEHVPVDEDAYYHRDPKKALKTFCEQRGVDPALRWDEEGHGPSKLFVATLTMELDGGRTMQGEGRASRKKQAEKLAALDLCIKLDKRQLLRSGGAFQSRAEMKRRTDKYGDNDDDDSFFDRTERPKKGKKEATSAPVVETYESLTAKLSTSDADIASIDTEIASIEASAAATSEVNADDELDQLVVGLETTAKLKHKKVLLDRRKVLTQTREQLITMIAIAKPHDVLTAKVTPLLNQTAKLVSDPSAPATPAVSDKSPVFKLPIPLSKKSVAAPLPASHPSLNPLAATATPELEQSPETGIPTDDRMAISPVPGTHAGSNIAVAVTDVTATGGLKPKGLPRKRTYAAMTRQESEAHARVQSEEMVDAAGKGENVGEEVVSKYGY